MLWAGVSLNVYLSLYSMVVEIIYVITEIYDLVVSAHDPGVSALILIVYIQGEIICYYRTPS